MTAQSSGVNGGDDLQTALTSLVTAIERQNLVVDRSWDVCDEHGDRWMVELTRVAADCDPGGE